MNVAVRGPGLVVTAQAGHSSRDALPGAAQPAPRASNAPRNGSLRSKGRISRTDGAGKSNVVAYTSTALASPATEVDLPAHLRTMNIVFVSSEVAPWSKTGGLADVMGSLPEALAARGHRVMVVTPRYNGVPEEAEPSGTVADAQGADVHYSVLQKDGVDYVFVDHPSFSRPGGLYGDVFGPFGDNQWRYKTLCLAALEAPLLLDVPGRGRYGEDCVFVANDWHAAMVPVYLAAKYRAHGVYQSARSILAIHNLRHQGVFPPGTFKDLGLPDQWYGCLEWQYPPHQRMGAYEEEGRAVNTMKAAIITCDRVVTVSPTYAGEIQSPEGGWGMEWLLGSRAPVVNGVLNGIDGEDWAPETDRFLPTNYGLEDFKEGKKANKLALQKELGLPENPDVPMVAFIGRLDQQKGTDILLESLPWLMAQGAQLVCLGTGTSDLENGLRWAEGAYPQQARGWVGFNVEMSHKITAAADIFIMPSRFEPCGLNQMYAMRYGTVPVVHATGGLKDSVEQYDPWTESGTGWHFYPCTAASLIHSLGLALATYRDHPKAFEGLQRRGMERDLSWNKAAESYEEIFRWAKIDPPYAS
ncbi:unnamed protein product [Pedinophyceae sp. YPF-701]|nr:unnamed protein product [Pedinophyceae sp. YPF-701]